MAESSTLRVYDAIDNWARIPEHVKLGTTHGVTEDTQGRIIVHHTGTPAVLFFDKQGNYLTGWGEHYGDGPHGMRLVCEGGREFLYLSLTSQHVVVKTDLEGNELLRLNCPDRPDIYAGPDEFVPTETAVASTGDIYVADGYGKSWIHRFATDGSYKGSFGGQGKEPGQLDCPHGIQIDTRSGVERLLVADRANVRLQYFTLEGELDGIVDQNLRYPCTAMPWRDELYIPDLFSRLTILDRNDQLITHLGDRPDCWKQEGWPNLPPEEWINGKFSSPHDLHVDAEGNIYVAEWIANGTGKLTKLVRR